jgi:hypothetical protein
MPTTATTDKKKSRPSSEFGLSAEIALAVQKVSTFWEYENDRFTNLLQFSKTEPYKH